MDGTQLRPAVAVIDHGTGNITSLVRALELGGADVQRLETPVGLEDADALVLPGVGAFPVAMEAIERLGFDAAIKERVAGGTPLLGICLGMQMLFDSSEEMGGAEGLGLLAGRVSELQTEGQRLPHIGWSPLTWLVDGPLREGLSESSPMYHVHSFVANPTDDGDILATAEHGSTFATAVGRDRILGLQFHPEKSSVEGLRMVANFVRMCASGMLGR